MSIQRVKSTVYVAAPLAMAALANRVAVALANAGHEVCSHWHNGGVVKESRDPVERHAALMDNIADMSEALAVVALTHIDNPRATYGEIGWALASGKSVIWVQGTEGDGSNLFDAHPLVERLFVRHGSEMPGTPIDEFLEREMIEMISEKL